jgi:23S rRNA pseudouridine1911/1915/1917 synthase
MNEAPELCHDASGVLGVRKPSGLPTQAPPGIGSVESWLRDRLPAGQYLGVPHRLDRAVSGIMVFATTPRAARQLSRQFERRQVVKTYLALALPTVAGSAELAALRRAGNAGLVWKNLIEKVTDEPRARIVAADSPAAGKPAATRVRLLAEGVGVCEAVLLHMQPETGRMHQLRVQAAIRGLPIVGDAAYGGPPADDGGDSRAAPIALHAWRLAFHDPETKQAVNLEAPPPSSWPEVRGMADAAASPMAARSSPRE